MTQEYPASHVYHHDGMDGIKAYAGDPNAIIVTDPPFNVGYHYGAYDDDMDQDDYITMLSTIVSTLPTVMIHYPETLYAVTAATGMVPRRVASWVYNSNTRRQHRDVAFYGVTPDFKRVRQPYKNPNDKRVRQRMADGSGGATLYDWWNVNQVKNVSTEKTAHPCQMPLKVMDNIIGILPTTPDTIIIDPFAGSGTTLLAAKNAGLKYVGFDIDANYVSICEERLDTSMGNTQQPMAEDIIASIEDIIASINEKDHT